MSKKKPPRHFQCPDCGVVTTNEYAEGVLFCHHNNNVFSLNQPDWHPLQFNEDKDGLPSYSRMAIITSIETAPVVEPDEWYVVEHRNPYGYDDNETVVVAGSRRCRVDDEDDGRSARKVAGPLPNQVTALRAANKLATRAKNEERERRGSIYPDYTHSFKAVPVDLLYEDDYR